MTTQIELNKAVPDFQAQATSQKDILLSACKGYNIVLYFYPKDNTPGCTAESQDFRDLYEQFRKLDTCIFGISRDSLESHEKFKEKYNLPFELISDSNEELCKMFDIIKLKNMYGREVLGIERTTLLIDKNGILRHKWEKVKVNGHAHAVLSAIEEL